MVPNSLLSCRDVFSDAGCQALEVPSPLHAFSSPWRRSAYSERSAKGHRAREPAH